MVIKALTSADMPIAWDIINWDDQCYGPLQWPLLSTIHRTCLHQHQLFFLHERRTSQTECWIITKAVCMSGAVHTHPPHALWCLPLRSLCKCRVHLVSGVSRGTAWCWAEAQIKCSLLVFERSREKWIGPIQYWSVYAVLWFSTDQVPNYNNIPIAHYKYLFCLIDVRQAGMWMGT